MKRFLLLLRRKSSSPGFSFIELSIVIALIALLVALSGAHISFVNRMIVRAELEHLYNTCFYVQRRALMTKKAQTISFDLEHNNYSVNGHVYRLPSHVLFGTMPGVKGPPSSSEHLITEPITFKDNTVIFHPDGVIKPGVVYLTDSGKRCTYALSCSVSAVSYLRKYQYTDKWQLLS